VPVEIEKPPGRLCHNGFAEFEYSASCSGSLPDYPTHQEQGIATIKDASASATMSCERAFDPISQSCMISLKPIAIVVRASGSRPRPRTPQSCRRAYGTSPLT
jgi:hypothetical protein